MKCVHSLWTGTPMFRLRYSALLLHTLSACLAERHFSRTELVTDDRGLNIAETLGWRYTTLVNILNDIGAGGLDHIWALGKFYAILAQSGDFLHCDSDTVFDKHPTSLRNARLAAQGVDFPSWYRGAKMREALETTGLPHGAVPYNCGVVGGTDLHLLRLYAEGALGMAQLFAHNDRCINGTITSMVIEQYWLGAFARQKEVRVETILPMKPTRADLKRAGYQHFHGGSKHECRNVAKIERRLQSEFPYAWERFTDGCARLGVVKKCEAENRSTSDYAEL